MDKPQKEQKIEKKIGQLQNQQKTLLNRKRSEERRARTHRLIGRCAILEAIFPAVVDMEGEEVKAFLIALSRLPGSMEAMETAWKNEGGEVTPSPVQLIKVKSRSGKNMGSRGIAKRHNKTEAPQGLENLGEMYQAAFGKDR